MSQPPRDWWARRSGPRIGCADVTIVSLASITAFVVLLLVLGRADFLLDKLPGYTKNPTVAASKNTDPTEAPALPVTRTATPTATATATATPPATTPTPTTVAATATPAFKLVSIKVDCRVRPNPTVRETELTTLRAGTLIRQLGPTKNAEGVLWYNVELNDNSGVRGWMQEVCFQG